MMLAAPANQQIQFVDVIDILTSDESKKYAPAGRMAAAIIAITEVLGSCLPQDLNERGFTPDEVAQHWHLAKSIAVIEMRMMRSDNAKPKKLKTY